MGHPASRPSSTGALRAARLGRYEVIGLLARGGMAELLLARRAGAGGFAKVVVLKRILPQFAHDPDFNRMFLDEARLAGTLDHPNVVRIFDVDEADGSFFFAMEYIHGEDLRKVLKAAVRRPDGLPLEWVISTVIEACKGLHHAHERRDFEGNPLNIVHRDISPANILVTYEGHVKVVDFGIARATRTNTYTQAGQRKGKVAYMSPEQCRGEIVDQRSDIFALGILLWEMSTLHRLFRTDDEFATMNLIVNQPIPRPSDRNPNYPLDLERIVLKALDKDREQRFASARELAEALEAYAAENGLDVSARRRAEVMRELLGERAFPWEDESQLQPVSLSSSSMVAADGHREHSASGLMEVEPRPSAVAGALGADEPAPRGRALIPIVVAVAAALAGGGLVWAMLPRNATPPPAAEVGGAAEAAEAAEAEASAAAPDPVAEPQDDGADQATGPEHEAEPQAASETGTGDGETDGAAGETGAAPEPEPEPEPAPASQATKKKTTKKTKPKKKSTSDKDKERDPDAFMPG